MAQHTSGQVVNAVLPNWFKPLGCSRLIRIGRDGDGGYLMCADDVDATSVLLSFGVSDDWSFERDFQARSRAVVHAFDGSVSSRFFVGRVLRSLLAMRLPSCLRNLKTAIDFRSFFSGPATFYPVYVGAESDDKTVSLSDAVKRYGQAQTTLKMDIEGTEHRLFDQIAEARKMFSAVVLEIHDLDLHMERVKKFLDDLDFKLIHIHVNNFAKVASAERVPQVVELTLSRTCRHSVGLPWPHPLDQPNNPQGPQVRLTFPRS